MIEIIDEQYNLEQAFYLEKLEKIVQSLGLKGDMTIKIGDPEEAKHLNMTYLERDYAPDVLSFPFNEELPEGYYVGDIFICYETAASQAKENNVTLEEELFTLMVHGVLHLAGFDHETDNGEMLKLQADLIKNYYTTGGDSLQGNHSSEK